MWRHNVTRMEVSLSVSFFVSAVDNVKPLAIPQSRFEHRVMREVCLWSGQLEFAKAGCKSPAFRIPEYDVHPIRTGEKECW